MVATWQNMEKLKQVNIYARCYKYKVYVNAVSMPQSGRKHNLSPVAERKQQNCQESTKNHQKQDHIELEATEIQVSVFIVQCVLHHSGQRLLLLQMEHLKTWTKFAAKQVTWPKKKRKKKCSGGKLTKKRKQQCIGRWHLWPQEHCTYSQTWRRNIMYNCS